MLRRLLPGVILLAGLLVLSACESQDAREWQAGQAALVAGEVPDDDFFTAEVTFCRKVGKKSGKRIGISEVFQPAKKRSVNALVDFGNVRPERLYAIHLAWIRPDGREMFRRYAEVRLEATEGAGFETVIDWKKAEDLHYQKQQRVPTESHQFTLSSRLNISYNRQRQLGDYLLRVYLDRRLLLEKKFVLEAGPESS